MFTKYEINTYPYPEEESRVEPKKKFIHPKNRSLGDTTEENSEHILETTFQPKFIFTKQNNNISFYQSSFKNSKNAEKNTFNKNITPILKTRKNVYKIKTAEIIQNNNEMIINKQRNKKRRIKNNINNINININPNTNSFDYNVCCDNEKKRINLNEQIIPKRNKRKKITKSCKRYFNIQKKDDFNVLSYKQPEYDTDISTTLANRNKIIQIYKKQGVDKIFLPSKRTHSPNIIGNKRKIEKYQIHTLKYQSFFGSFNTSKPRKIIKSVSKRTINQLHDFNIDKLIEIGDKYAVMHKAILPLGKIMNNNILNFNPNRARKNRYKIPINTYNNCFNYSKYSKIKTNNNDNSYLEEDKENIMANNQSGQNRLSKKIMYKNTTNNTKNRESEKISETVRKYLSFKNEGKNSDIKNNNNFLESSIVIRRRNNNINNNNRTFIKSQKSFDKTGLFDCDYENQNDIIPKKKVQKIIKNLNEDLDTDNNSTKEIKQKKNDDRKENIVKKRKRLSIGDNKKILIDINGDRTNNKYKNNDKQKNRYYGYDDRHNLEDTINNHTYYESLHSKKVL